MDCGKGFLILCDFKRNGHEYGCVSSDYKGLLNYESWPLTDDVWNDAHDIAEFVKSIDNIDSFFHWALFGLGVVDAKTEGYFVEHGAEYEKFCNEMDIERANGNNFPSFLPKLRAQMLKGTKEAKIVLYPLGFILPECSVVEKDDIMKEMEMSSIDFSIFAGALILRFLSKVIKPTYSGDFRICGVLSIPLNYYYSNDDTKASYKYEIATIPRQRYKIVAKICERILRLPEILLLRTKTTSEKKKNNAIVTIKYGEENGSCMFYLSNCSRLNHTIFLYLMNHIYKIYKSNSNNLGRFDLSGVYLSWHNSSDNMKSCNDKYGIIKNYNELLIITTILILLT